MLYIFILRLFQATHVDDATSAYFEIYLESMAVGPYTKLNYRSGAVVGDDDRSVNDRALTVRARLMKDVSAGEMIGCRVPTGLCSVHSSITHVIHYWHRVSRTVTLQWIRPPTDQRGPIHGHLDFLNRCPWPIQQTHSYVTRPYRVGVSRHKHVISHNFGGSNGKGSKIRRVDTAGMRCKQTYHHEVSVTVKMQPQRQVGGYVLQLYPVKTNVDQQTLAPDDDYVVPHQRLWTFDVPYSSVHCRRSVTERFLLQPLVCGTVFDRTSRRHCYPFSLHVLLSS